MAGTMPHIRVQRHHGLTFDGPINNLHEGPAIGNGDVGAIVQVFHDEFRLHLGKNDLWDARFDNETAREVVTQDDLIRLSRDYGFRVEGAAYRGTAVYDRPPPAGLRYSDETIPRKIYPSPKVAGLIRVFYSGSRASRLHTFVDLATGLVTCEVEINFGWHGKGMLYIEAFVDRLANVIRLRLRQDRRIWGGFRLCVEKAPDGGDHEVPLPEVQRDGDDSGVITQRIPAEYGVPEFQWHLAAAFPAPDSHRGIHPVAAYAWPRRLWQACDLPADAAVEFAVGLTTSHEPARRATGGGGDSLTRARRLAGTATARGYDRARAAHVRAWAAFWDRSGVELGDKELEKTWYRNLFALACVISPKAMAPMGCGNVTIAEPLQNAVHSGYTVNMNIQKMFLASMPTNHPEWNDAYANWLDGMKPTFRYLAKLIFGLPGIHSPHWLFPFLPPERQINSNQCGRALGMTGWHGQPLWWRWEHFRDRTFLRQRAYPYFKEVACFYWRYLRKYLDESGDLYPSLNLEGPPWTKDFVHNRDCFIDLILFRNTFQWAIASAEVLKVDAAWRQRWAWALAQIRPVQTDRLPGHAGYWIRADKNDAPPDPEARLKAQCGQAVTAAWTVFPGEYVDGDETTGLAPQLRAIMRRNQWWKWHPGMIWIHHWWCAIPALRMGLGNAFSMARAIILRERFASGLGRTTFGIPLLPDAGRAPEDNYLGVVATTEMLLQSQGGILRLFPVWPKRKKAAFRGFPARGGFLVSAAWDPATGLRAEIQSLAGEPCRVRWTARRLPVVTCDGRRVAIQRAGREITFQLAQGALAQLTSRTI